MITLLVKEKQVVYSKSIILVRRARINLINRMFLNRIQKRIVVREGLMAENKKRESGFSTQALKEFINEITEEELNAEEIYNELSPYYYLQLTRRVGSINSRKRKQ